MSRNLIARLCVAAVAIPIILWVCYEGGWWLFGMISLFALVAISEFLIAEGYRPTSFFFWFPLLAIVTVFAAFAAGFASGEEEATLALMTLSVLGPLVFLGLFMITNMVLALGRETPAQLFERSCRLFWGTAYIGMLYPFVLIIGVFGGTAGAYSGGDLLLFLFGLLWVGDTSAMWVGKAFGKHMLAPTVSPNKTVEGFIGGILGALAIGVLMIFWKLSAIPWYHVLIMAAGSSVFGQLGDLVESMWKRSLGIKDSSALIPGHGGILDRFDSLLFAGPFLFLYLLLIS